MGYNAVMVNANGYYKIQLGSFINKVDAEKLMKDLKSKKIESIIVYY
jgi:cell division septation protein DedD